MSKFKTGDIVINIVSKDGFRDVEKNYVVISSCNDIYRCREVSLIRDSPIYYTMDCIDDKVFGDYQIELNLQWIRNKNLIKLGIEI